MERERETQKPPKIAFEMHPEQFIIYIWDQMP